MKNNNGMLLTSVVETSEGPEQRQVRHGDDAIECVIENIMKFLGWKNYLSDLQCVKLAAALRVLAAEFEK